MEFSAFLFKTLGLVWTVKFLMKNQLEETALISSISFGLFDPIELENSSVCEVKKAIEFENGLPVDEGLSDARMGTVSRDYLSE